MRQLAAAALTLVCLGALPAAASWGHCSLGEGHSLALTADGRRVVFLTDLGGAATLVSCRLDGGQPAVHTGPRVGLADLPADTAQVTLVDSDRAAIAGNRIAVLLGAPGMRDLGGLLGATVPTALASARCAPLVAALDGTDRILILDGASTRSLRGPRPVRSCSLSDDGALLLARGEMASWLLDTASGAVLLEVPGAVSCLSGDGMRLAWCEGGEIHRLDRARGAETTIAAPVAPPRALSLGSEGRKLFVADDRGVSMAAWAGEVFVQLAAVERATGFAFVADGSAAAWAADGEVWVAAAETPEDTRPFATPARGGSPPLAEVLRGLEPLMAAIMGQGALPESGGRVAAPDGSILVTRAEPPRLSLRAPPGWSIEEPPDGLVVEAPDGSARLEAALVAGDDPDEWARACAPSPDLPQPRPGLLAGREALAWTVSPDQGDRGTRLVAARTAEGLLTAVLTWSGASAPPELEACLESLALR